MKRRTAFLAGAALAALCGGAQAGELRGTYFAIEGGASWVGDERFFQDLIFTTGATSHTEFRSAFDTGWSVFGSAGYAFDNDFRVELEVGYRHNDIDRLATTGGSILTPAGDLGEFTLMANILYDIHFSKRLSASIGAGVGADLARFEVGTLGFEDDDWVFAYQGLLGLNYAIGERTQLFLNYRYLRADAPNYSLTVPGLTQRVGSDGDLEKQAVTLGLRFALHGEAAPPPPAPLPPPPPPPPPKAPKEFIVFFGFDKYNLSPEALRVVEDAAYAAKEWGSASILIVAHTDSMGSNGYNQELSTRRANAVRAALESLGVGADKISATGKGESELLVQTGDRVKEPQNRRATINLQ